MAKKKNTTIIWVIMLAILVFFVIPKIPITFSIYPLTTNLIVKGWEGAYGEDPGQITLMGYQFQKLRDGSCKVLNQETEICNIDSSSTCETEKFIFDCTQCGGPGNCANVNIDGFKNYITMNMVKTQYPEGSGLAEVNIKSLHDVPFEAEVDLISSWDDTEIKYPFVVSPGDNLFTVDITELDKGTHALLIKLIDTELEPQWTGFTGEWGVDPIYKDQAAQYTNTFTLTFDIGEGTTRDELICCESKLVVEPPEISYDLVFLGDCVTPEGFTGLSKKIVADSFCEPLECTSDADCNFVCKDYGCEENLCIEKSSISSIEFTGKCEANKCFYPIACAPPECFTDGDCKDKTPLFSGTNIYIIIGIVAILFLLFWKKIFRKR